MIPTGFENLKIPKDVLNRRISKLVTQKIKKYKPPNDINDEVIFNSLEELSKRLVSMEKGTFKEINQKAAKKKNFLLESIKIKKEKIAKIGSGIIESTLAKIPKLNAGDSNPPFSKSNLNIFLKLVHSEFKQVFTNQNFTPKVLASLKDGHLPALVQMYRVYDESKQKYSEDFEKLVGNAIGKRIKMDPEDFKELNAKMPFSASVISKVFENNLEVENDKPIPLSDDITAAAVDFLGESTIFRPIERKLALNALLKLSRCNNDKFRVASIKVLCTRLYKTSFGNKFVCEMGFNGVKKALNRTLESLLPAEMGENFIQEKIQEAEELMNKKILSEDGDSQANLKESTVSTKEEYINSVKSAALIIKQKTEKEFKESFFLNLASKTQRDCELFFTLPFLKPSLFMLIPSTIFKNVNNERHKFWPFVLKEASNALRAYIECDKTSKEILELLLCPKRLRDWTISPQSQALFYIGISSFIAKMKENNSSNSILKSKKAPENKIKCRPEENIILGENRNAMNPEEFKKKLFTLFDQQIQPENNKRKEFLPLLKTKTICALYPLMTLGQQKQHFDLIFRETETKDLQRLIEEVFGSSDSTSDFEQNSSETFKTLLASLGSDSDMIQPDLNDEAQQVKSLKRWRTIFKSIKEENDFELPPNEENEGDKSLKNTLENESENLDLLTTAEKEEENIKKQNSERAIWMFEKLHTATKGKGSDAVIKSLEAVNHLMKMKNVLTVDILRKAMENLSNENGVEVLLLRTLIQAYLLHPELVDTVLTVLLKYLERRPWKDETVWTGFIKCVAWTLPCSVEIMARMKKRLALKALTEDEFLKRKLKELYLANPQKLDCLSNLVRAEILSESKSETRKRRKRSKRSERERSGKRRKRS